MKFIALGNDMVRKVLLLLLIPVFTGIGGYFLGLTAQQLIILSVFTLSILGTFLFWQLRLSFVFLGSTALFLISGVHIEQFLRFASLDVIIFLIGMMIVVGMLKESGVFHWLVSVALKRRSVDGARLYIIIIVLSAVLSALTGEVTSMIVMMAVILEISDSLEINPTPLVISSVLATNIGSAATVLGNPIGILIALRSSLGFEDFLTHALPVSVAVLFAAVFVLCFWYRGYIKEISSKLMLKDVGSRFPVALSIDARMAVNLAIFCMLILCLAFHRRLELFFGFSENRLLVVLPIIFAGISIIFRCERVHYCIVHEVEWKSLLFFMFLFAQAGILQASGLAQLLAQGLVKGMGNHPIVLSGVVLSSSGLLSGFLDNTVVVSSFIPVIKNLHLMHFSLKPLWWCVLFGACFGGNITAIGSTANIVALGLLEKQKGIKVDFGQWLKIGLIVASLSLFVSYLAVIILPVFSY